MYKILNSMVTIFLASLSYLVGGFDELFTAMIVICLANWITGSLKALKKGKFSPIAFVWGFVNNLIMIIIVIVVNFVQSSMDLPIPLREITLWLLTINLAISVIQNSSVFIKGLEPLSKYLDTVKIKIIKIITIGDDEQ